MATTSIESIAWTKFPAPSAERPYGLICDAPRKLDNWPRKTLFKIANENLPQNGEHRWTMSNNGRSWAFASEGDRSYFVMLTSGAVDAI